MASRAHADRIEQAFSLQAGAFEDASGNRVFTSDAAWITAAVECAAGDLVLDVAAGSGHAARQLAPRVRAVVALDATAAMLDQGQAAAREEGINNIVFCRGDAEQLPFSDGSFDTVVSRFAFHHLERPALVLAEMSRCARTDAQVVVADLLASDDAEAALLQDRLETLRDPSHTRLLSYDELAELFTAAGRTVVGQERRRVERPLEPWLAQSATANSVADEIRTTLQDELDGGPASGFSPRLDQARELLFTQTFGLVRSVS